MDNLDRKRLAQLLGMLGSQHDGEILNAARLAAKLVRAQRCTWEEILNAPANLSPTNRAAQGMAGEIDELKQRLNATYQAGFRAGVNSAYASLKRPENGWRQWAADLVKEEEDNLSDWEINFFGGFANGRFAVPTVKQRAIFADVAERLDRELPEPIPRDLPF